MVSNQLKDGAPSIRDETLADRRKKSVNLDAGVLSRVELAHIRGIERPCIHDLTAAEVNNLDLSASLHADGKT